MNQGILNYVTVAMRAIKDKKVGQTEGKME